MVGGGYGELFTGYKRKVICTKVVSFRALYTVVDYS